MNITALNHYKNSLAIQFGMTISGNEALVTAYENENEVLDALFESWVREFDLSDADDSYEFFEGKIYDWIQAHSDERETVAIAQSGLRPGERTYAIVHEKKQNALGRRITTKNLVVKPILCTEIRFAEGEEPKVIGYAWADEGYPFYEVEAKDCFVSEAVAKEALKERRRLLRAHN